MTLADRTLLVLGLVVLAGTLWHGWSRSLTVEKVQPQPVGMRVDLNHADAATLRLLPMIGRVTAAGIVADREQHGPYHQLDDLRRVRGVGPRRVETLEPFVTLTPIHSPDAVSAVDKP